MNQARIDEIKKRCEDAKMGSVLFDAMDAFVYSMELLEALEAAQAENEQIRNALESIQKRVTLYENGEPFYYRCCSKYAKPNIAYPLDHGHDDNCPFHILTPPHQP